MERLRPRVHVAGGHRAQETGVVRHAERDLAPLDYTVGGAHRRERLRDGRVHAAVHDAHRLADGRHDREPRGAFADLDELLELEADRHVEGVLVGQAPAIGLVGYVGHPADATCGSRRRRADMGAGTWDSHHAITTLMFRYAECVDTADFDGIAALFDHGRITNEGVVGAIEGPDAVRKLYQRTNRVHGDG